MAKDKKSFLLYCDQQGVFNKLPDEIAGKLIKHIFAYVNDENPPCDDLLLTIAFEPIKTQLKRDLRKYDDYIDKQKFNGAKGGRPKKDEITQITQPFFEEPKKADNVNANDTATVNDIKVNKGFIKPTIQEIEIYMAEKGMENLAERFFYFYEAKGWVIGKNKIKDWKSCVMTWKKNSTNNLSTPQIINRKVFSLKEYDERT
jgi:hypothetical protein